MKCTVIRKEPKNGGTVRHLNHAVQACSGDYIIALAGDDNLWNNSTLTRYVKGFSHAPKDCLIEMAQTGMYDEALKVLEEYYLKPHVQAALKKTETDTSDLQHGVQNLGTASFPTREWKIVLQLWPQLGPQSWRKGALTAVMVLSLTRVIKPAHRGLQG